MVSDSAGRGLVQRPEIFSEGSRGEWRGLNGMFGMWTFRLLLLAGFSTDLVDTHRGMLQKGPKILGVWGVRRLSFSENYLTLKSIEKRRNTIQRLAKFQF